MLLTGRGEQGSLARDLFERWDDEQDGAQKWGAGKVGTVKELKGDLDLEVSGTTSSVTPILTVTR